MKKNNHNQHHQEKLTCVTQTFFLFFFLVQLIFIICKSAAFGQGQPTAKYIILMIADGWGAKQIEATNKYTESIPTYQSDPSWVQSWMSTFPWGVVMILTRPGQISIM